MHRLPWHARLVVLAKSWHNCHLMKEATLHGEFPLSTLAILITLKLWFPLGAMGGVLPLWHFLRLLLLLFPSNQLIWTPLLWFLEVTFFGFWDHLQKAYSMPFIAKAAQQWAKSQSIWWNFHATYHSELALLSGEGLLKNQLKMFLSTSLIFY
jgi:hypothetical protein